MDVKIIIRTCNGREAWRNALVNLLNPIVIEDKTNNAMDTFMIAMEASGDCPAIHIEDDAVLTTCFLEKAHREIEARPNSVINFFSMRKADLEVGSRWCNGGTFSATVCFYMPKNYSKMVYGFYPVWERKFEHPIGFDLMIADWLKLRHEKFWIVIPNLADHRIGKSMINPRRSSKRKSLTFEA